MRLYDWLRWKIWGWRQFVHKWCSRTQLTTDWGGEVKPALISAAWKLGFSLWLWARVAEHTTESSRSPCPKKVRMPKSKAKTMLICFVNCKGIMHWDFVPRGQAINHKSCHQDCECTRQQVPRVRPEIPPDKSILHHANATQQTIFSIRTSRWEKIDRGPETPHFLTTSGSK